MEEGATRAESTETTLEPEDRKKIPFKRAVLLGAIFLISICGLVYELLAGTISAYLVGSAVLQFSLVVGAFLAAMGVGAFLSRFAQSDLLDVFIYVETGVGVIGGFSALILNFAFAHLPYYTPALYMVSMLTGVLIGMEIPIVIRLLKDHLSLDVNVASVLGLDYLGALVASVLFPLLVLPYLGQMAAAFFFGLLNVGVALICSLIFRNHLTKFPRHLRQTLLAVALLLTGLVFSEQLVSYTEGTLYSDTVILAKTTKHQRVVVTNWRDDTRLFLDGNLQFSTTDEHRYHEPLVHSAMGYAGPRKRVLILGGGDGMAAREVLKHDQVERVDVVDLDRQLTRLFSNHPVLKKLNSGSLNDGRVHIINQDAMKFLESLDTNSPPYHRIIADLPDPRNYNVAKLYSAEFYRLLFRHLSGDGIFVTQATSPYFGTKSFWCIHNTLQSVQNPLQRNQTVHVNPFHAYIPSFGDWGFILASPVPIKRSDWSLRVNTRYLSPEKYDALFTFPKDVDKIDTDINHLNEPVLVKYYEQDWSTYNE